ncbi:MAG: hypothetical protein WBD41_14070, partial [Rhodococcus sp. (in: high G+C Gram-positive bacteria)]
SKSGDVGSGGATVDRRRPRLTDSLLIARIGVEAEARSARSSDVTMANGGVARKTRSPTTM